MRLSLPLWLDAFGTVLSAYIAGPVGGSIVGLTGNLIYAVENRLSIIYSVTSVTLGIISAVIGSLVYRIILQVAYKVEMPSYAVKLLSTVIVVIALTIPRLRRLAAQRRADRKEDAA